MDLTHIQRKLKSKMGKHPDAIALAFFFIGRASMHWEMVDDLRENKDVDMETFIMLTQELAYTMEMGTTLLQRAGLTSEEAKDLLNGVMALSKQVEAEMKAQDNNAQK